jgi:hypothetical protein
VTQRSESRAAIEGVPEGSIIALVDPATVIAASTKTAAPAAPAPGPPK